QVDRRARAGPDGKRFGGYVGAAPTRGGGTYRRVNDRLRSRSSGAAAPTNVKRKLRLSVNLIGTMSWPPLFHFRCRHDKGRSRVSSRRNCNLSRNQGREFLPLQRLPKRRPGCAANGR